MPIYSSNMAKRGEAWGYRLGHTSLFVFANIGCEEQWKNLIPQTMVIIGCLHYMVFQWILLLNISGSKKEKYENVQTVNTSNMT